MNMKNLKEFKKIQKVDFILKYLIIYAYDRVTIKNSEKKS